MRKLVLQKGRPIDENGRLEKEIRTYNFLDELEIQYERVDHEAAITMEACEAIDNLLQATICKNLFLCNRQETDFYLLLMPGEKKFKTKELSAQLGVARLSFAKESYMQEFLDVTPGSVSVLGLMNDVNQRVKLCIDEDVLEGTEIGCHPCINTSSVKFKTQDLIHKIIPALKHEPVIVHLSDDKMLRLRPYRVSDASTILSWCDDENAFYKWTAGVLGKYPITEEQFNNVNSLMAFTAVQDDEIVGFFTMRKPGNSYDELRFGFVTVDKQKRGKGYGKEMLHLGLKYARDIFGAKKVSLGVFENNESAYFCYKSVGFSDVILDETEKYRVLDEEWNCLELEIIF